MAGKSKIVTGALDALTDAASKVLPDNIFDLPSFREAVRAFKKSLMGEEASLSTAERAAIPDVEVDGTDIRSIASGMDSDKDIFANSKPFEDWAAGKIELQDFQKIKSPTGDPAYPFDHAFPTIPPTSGTELLSGANYPLDPRSYVLRDLEMNYGLSKSEIMDYLKKNDLIAGKSEEEFNFNEQQMKALKDAFASGDPNNPIVKRVRGALADLSDEDDLVEVTPEMIYGKSN